MYMDKPIIGCLGEFSYNEGTAVIYVDLINGTYIAGTICNLGICPIVKLPYDSAYKHYQHIENINELLIEQGYFPF